MPKYYVYPAIGIARLGNSESEFFVGPEVPYQDINPNFTGNNFCECYETYSLNNRSDQELNFKDSQGKVKRQAARFRIFEIDDCDRIVREVTAKEATIEWEVHIANRKSINYQFNNAMDLGKLSQNCELRNAFVTDLQERKDKLLIEPSVRNIQGRDRCGKDYLFDDGTFFGGTSQERTVYLGELRTDCEGRLLVLGGRGKSDSYNNSPITTFANNDNWHDDISDGTVRATITIDGERHDAEPAMVAVTPPNFAPGMPGVVTMYDVVNDLLNDKPQKTQFYRDIFPILNSLVENQGVNLGYFMAFGDNAPANFTKPSILEKLKSSSVDNLALREAVFKQFRITPELTVAQRAEEVEKLLNSPNISELDESLKLDLAGTFNEAIKKAQVQVQADKLPPIFGDSYGDAPDSPLVGLSLTSTQYQHMHNWAIGEFELDTNPKENPTPLDGINDPLETILSAKERAHILTKTNLQECLGGPFHPGIELTWFLRCESMWNVSDKVDRMRLNVINRGEEVQDYFGPTLTPEVALKDMFNVSGPGTLTRFMGVPWQSDEGSCRSNQDYDTAQYLPTITFWSARVPNQVLSQRSFQQTQNTDLSAAQRHKFFSYRQDWLRFLREGGQNPRVTMVDNWDKIGIVVKKPIDDFEIDSEEVKSAWVESQVNVRYLAHDASYRQLLNLETLSPKDILHSANSLSKTKEDIEKLNEEDKEVSELGLAPRIIPNREKLN